jgi:Ca2+-binding RTX toxin-like protein
MKPPTIMAALGAALAVGIAANATPAHAAATSASFVDGTATLNLDGADDNVTVSVANGVFVHGETTGGLNSIRDWDSATAGDQTVPADGNSKLDINGGAGNDSVTVVAKGTEISSVIMDGGPGDDVLTGADSPDALSGGDGNDRLVGGKGLDKMGGDAGNDTMVWNQGDGSDVVDGGAGNDATEVNGAPTLGDVFAIAPDANPGSIRFDRTNLGPFHIVATTERFEVNGLGGDDSLTSSAGVGARTLLSADGGAGADTITGTDGADLIVGGEDNDVLNGAGGDDRIVGDRGADTMNGGTGDDTLVWNNGDGSDVVNGDAGRDDVEVNGAPAAGDVETVQPNGSRIKFARSNLVPFSIDIASSETMHANGLGGDDTIAVSDVGSYEVTAQGGAGNDTLSGGSSSDSLFGGSGNDTITPGGGLDIVAGDDGNDRVNVRDNTADVARGGEGNDSVVADSAVLDVIDGFESVDRPPVVTPAPGNNGTHAVRIDSRDLKVNRRTRTALIRISAPAGQSGNSTGSLALLTAKRVKLAGLKAVLQLGSTRYSVAPGTSTTVKVKLANGIQRLADRKGRIKVRAVASTGASGQIASTSKRVTLALGKAKTGR